MKSAEKTAKKSHAQTEGLERMALLFAEVGIQSPLPPPMELEPA